MLIRLDLLNLKKLFCFIHLFKAVKTWHGASSQKVYEQVDQWYQIISSARCEEIELIYACENHVSSKRFKSWFFNMLVCLLVNISCRKAEINDVDVEVLARLAQLVQIKAIVEKDVIRLKIIINVASLMYRLHDVQQLKSKIINELFR